MVIKILLPCDAMHSMDCAVARCPSCLYVHLSVTHRYSVKMVTYILTLFSTLCSHTILVYPYQMGW